MTPKQYRNALDRLELRQREASQLLDVAPRTSRRWESGTAPVPRAVALVLLLMIKYQLAPADVLALLEPKRKARKTGKTVSPF